MNFKSILFILFFLSLSWVSTASAESPVIKNMIVFGDSLSDVGNNTWILMDSKNIGAPITNTNNHNLPYVWINYLAESKLSKPVYPSSTPGLNPLQDNISYAYASAETGDEYLNSNWPQDSNAPPYINTEHCQSTGPGVIKNQTGEIISTCNPGLLKQIDIYLNDVHHQPSKNTVFFIWSGANDLQNFLSIYFQSHHSIPSLLERRALENRVASHVNEAKNKLIDAGVSPSMIYIMNLPDLSKVPAVITGDGSWEFYVKKILLTITSTLSEVSRDYNSELLMQDTQDKYFLSHSHYIDVAHFFNELITNPDKYQLNNVTESCVAKNATPSCNGYVFYNDKHPTTIVYKILSDDLLLLLDQSV